MTRTVSSDCTHSRYLLVAPLDYRRRVPACRRLKDKRTLVEPRQSMQAVAPALGVEVTPIGVHDIGDIERAVEAFTRSANGGLIVTGTATLPAVTRDLIITLAARHKLPAVYSLRHMVTAGGLVSYGNVLFACFPIGK